MTTQPSSTQSQQPQSRFPAAGKGMVVWLTGLSGAGKSTLASQIAETLRAEGRLVEILDGDVIRTNLSKGLGFSKEDRDTNIRRIGFVCQLLARNGVTTIAAAISPYKDVRDEVRAAVTADGAPFVEVYVRCPIEALVKRDTKGLYAKALAGELPQFTGVSDPYEPPESPEAVVDTDRETVAQSARTVLEAIRRSQANNRALA